MSVRGWETRLLHHKTGQYTTASLTTARLLPGDEGGVLEHIKLSKALRQKVDMHTPMGLGRRVPSTSVDSIPPENNAAAHRHMQNKAILLCRSTCRLVLNDGLKRLRPPSRPLSPPPRLGNGLPRPRPPRAHSWCQLHPRPRTQLRVILDGEEAPKHAWSTIADERHRRRVSVRKLLLSTGL